MAESRVHVRNHEEARNLFGARDRNLRRLRDMLHIDVVLRGDELHLTGEASEVERGEAILGELKTVIARKGYLPDEDFDHVLERNQPRTAATEGSEIDVFHKARKIRPLGAGQQEYVEAIRKHDLVICAGPAGSGKTYLATAMAVNALRREQVRKIVLVRPAVEAGEKLGFLPGDMLAKVNPFLRPLLDALGDILDFDQVQRYIDKDVIEIIPLAFMRGRTLNNTFMILDEAQNSTLTQMKMFLTRMGHHSKIVVTGDVTQTDLPEHIDSGLLDAMRRLHGVPGVATVSLSGGDIVRHPLVRRIVAAYDADRPDRPASVHSFSPSSAAGSKPVSSTSNVVPETAPDTL